MEKQKELQADLAPVSGIIAYITNSQGRKNEAVKILKDTLLENPRYEWGWNLLFMLLREETHLLINDTLRNWPVKNLIDLPQIRMKRLFLLHESGIEGEDLESEWKELLKDFPTMPDLYMRRFDMLENLDPDQAEKVIREIAVHYPNDSYILTRLLPFVYRKSKTEGENLAYKIFEDHECTSEWPASNAWNFLFDYCKGKDFEPIVSALEFRIHNQVRLNLHAFHLCIRANFLKRERVVS